MTVRRHVTINLTQGNNTRATISSGYVSQRGFFICALLRFLFYVKGESRWIRPERVHAPLINLCLSRAWEDLIGGNFLRGPFALCPSPSRLTLCPLSLSPSLLCRTIYAPADLKRHHRDTTAVGNLIATSSSKLAVALSRRCKHRRFRVYSAICEAQT